MLLRARLHPQSWLQRPKRNTRAFVFFCVMAHNKFASIIICRTGTGFLYQSTGPRPCKFEMILSFFKEVVQIFRTFYGFFAKSRIITNLQDPRPVAYNPVRNVLRSIRTVPVQDSPGVSRSNTNHSRRRWHNKWLMSWLLTFGSFLFKCNWVATMVDMLTTRVSKGWKGDTSQFPCSISMTNFQGNVQRSWWMLHARSGIPTPYTYTYQCCVDRSDITMSYFCVRVSWASCHRIHPLESFSACQSRTCQALLPLRWLNASEITNFGSAPLTYSYRATEESIKAMLVGDE